MSPAQHNNGANRHSGGSHRSADKQPADHQPIRHQIIWRRQSFAEFTVAAWHTIAMARVAVFVVEQQCPYQELDQADIHAHHVSAWNAHNELLAYLRVLPAGRELPAGGHFQTPSIGRVLTTAAARGQGLGRPLMQHGIAYCHALYPGQPISLSAQHHLQAFYASLGFAGYGAVYLEDGIPHIDMRLEKPPAS